MATIIKTKTNLEKQYRIEKLKNLFWILSSLVFIFLLIPTKGLTMIFFVICLVLSSLHERKMCIYKSGLNGENLTLDLFQDLPNQYAILNDIHLYHKGISNQIDYLIIGPSGIFVVEVKNHNGKIVGNANDYKWNQVKARNEGKFYTRPLRNPIKQVRRQVYHLSHFLRQNNIDSWVQGIVFFSNKSSHVSVRNQQHVPVFNMNQGNGMDLLNYIKKYKKTVLKSQEINQIVNLLK